MSSEEPAVMSESGRIPEMYEVEKVLKEVIEKTTITVKNNVSESKTLDIHVDRKSKKYVYSREFLLALALSPLAQKSPFTEADLSEAYVYSRKKRNKAPESKQGKDKSNRDNVNKPVKEENRGGSQPVYRKLEPFFEHGERQKKSAGWDDVQFSWERRKEKTAEIKRNLKLSGKLSAPPGFEKPVKSNDAGKFLLNLLGGDTTTVTESKESEVADESTLVQPAFEIDAFLFGDAGGVNNDLFGGALEDSTELDDVDHHVGVPRQSRLAKLFGPSSENEEEDAGNVFLAEDTSVSVKEEKVPNDSEDTLPWKRISLASLVGSVAVEENADEEIKRLLEERQNELKLRQQVKTGLEESIERDREQAIQHTQIPSAMASSSHQFNPTSVLAHRGTLTNNPHPHPTSHKQPAPPVSLPLPTPFAPIINKEIESQSSVGVGLAQWFGGSAKLEEIAQSQGNRMNSSKS